MAKVTRVDGRGPSRAVAVGARGKKPEFPLNTAESNAAGDRQSQILHVALLCGAVLVLASIVLFGVSQVIAGVSGQQLNWAALIVGVSALVATFFVGRGLLWLSFFAPIMLSAKNKAWKSQEGLCRKAIACGKLFPAGGSSAALVLVHSLVGRGEFDDALKIGEDAFTSYGSNAKFDENLGPMYAALGIAQQVKGDVKQSIAWNERAIESFGRSIENFGKKKGIIAKMAGAQAGQVADQLRTQLAVAHCNNGANHMSLMNYRQAKLDFQKAMEHAAQAPDSAEKADLVRACREQLSRLKHA